MKSLSEFINESLIYEAAEDDKIKKTAKKILSQLFPDEKIPRWNISRKGSSIYNPYSNDIQYNDHLINSINKDAAEGELMYISIAVYTGNQTNELLNKLRKYFGEDLDKIYNENGLNVAIRKSELNDTLVVSDLYMWYPRIETPAIQLLKKVLSALPNTFAPNQDVLGQQLSVGDEVLFVSKASKQLQWGKIKNINKKVSMDTEDRELFNYNKGYYQTSGMTAAGEQCIKLNDVFDNLNRNSDDPGKDRLGQDLKEGDPIAFISKDSKNLIFGIVKKIASKKVSIETVLRDTGRRGNSTSTHMTADGNQCIKLPEEFLKKLV